MPHTESYEFKYNVDNPSDIYLSTNYTNPIKKIKVELVGVYMSSLDDDDGVVKNLKELKTTHDASEDYSDKCVMHFDLVLDNTKYAVGSYDPIGDAFITSDAELYFKQPQTFMRMKFDISRLIDTSFAKYKAVTGVVHLRLTYFE